MSLHDKIADKALSMGETASEFHVAAQKHANATWIFLIITGIAWYFTNWVWAIIPAVICVYTAIKSISSTMIATRLEKFDHN